MAPPPNSPSTKCGSFTWPGGDYPPATNSNPNVCKACWLDFYNALHGRTHEQRKRLRGRLLAVSLDDLQRVGETWLARGNACTAVIAPNAKAVEVEALGLAIEKL